LTPENDEMEEIVAPLLGTECGSCGTRFSSSTPVCRSCGSDSLKQVELPDTGRLITYTVIRYPPAPFIGEEPYTVGVIELDDGTRVLANLRGTEWEDADREQRVVLHGNHNGRTVFRTFSE